MNKVFQIIDTSVGIWLDEFQENDEAYGQTLKTSRQKYFDKIEMLTKQ